MKFNPKNLYFIKNIATLFFVYLLLYPFTALAQIKDKDILLRLEMNQEKIFVGEMVLLNLVIYTKIGIENIEMLSDIEYTKQYKIEINNNYDIKDTTIIKELDGEQYVSKILKQYILHSFSEGEDTILSSKIIFKIDYLKEDGITIGKHTLKLDKDYPITISSLPEESRFAPKNGQSILVQHKDSLSNKGIWIADIEYYAFSNPIFITPADFGLSQIATVEIEYLGRAYKQIDDIYYATKTFRHIIYFHEKGNYFVRPEWRTWNTKNASWDTIYGKSKVITISNTSTKKTKVTNKPTIVQDSSISEDIVFLVDVSTSMLAQDFAPNRHEAVKIILKKMIANKSENQQISIVIFSGECMTLCPLTTDTFMLLTAIDNILVSKLMHGTAIGTSIMFGLYELSKSKSPNKHIFMMTDGVNNAGFYSPQFASILATELNIPIHSLGIGCKGEALTPVAQRPDGSFIFDRAIVQIDELILQNIGQQTGGNYSRVTCNADFKILDDFDKLIHESKPLKVKTQDSIELPKYFVNAIWEDIQFQNESSKKKYYSNK